MLDVTAEEVQAVAQARLHPRNRAVLVYEPTTGDDTDADETATDATEEEGAAA